MYYTYMGSDLLDFGLLTLDLGLLSVDGRVFLIDIAGELAVLGTKPLERRLDMRKLLPYFVLLLTHILIVQLHLIPQ